MSKMLSVIYENISATANDEQVQRDAASLEARFKKYSTQGIDLTSRALSDAESAIRQIADAKDLRPLLSLYVASSRIPAMQGIWQRAWQLARAVYGQIALEGDQLSWDSSKESALSLKTGKKPAIYFAGKLDRKLAQDILAAMGKGRYFRAFDALKDQRAKGNAVVNQITALREAATAFNLKALKDSGRDVSLTPAQRAKAKEFAAAAAILKIEPAHLQRLIEALPDPSAK